jgi:hypothetical protein
MDARSSISTTLKDHSSALPENELKKIVVSALREANDELDKKSCKKLFHDALTSLIDEGIVNSIEGVVSLVQKSTKKRKLSTDELQPSTASSTSAKPKIEDLWKNGEQYWRDGTLDQDYLLNNPDKYDSLSYKDSHLNYFNVALLLLKGLLDYSAEISIEK